jgi:hypothetical protein
VRFVYSKVWTSATHSRFSNQPNRHRRRMMICGTSAANRRPCQRGPARGTACAPPPQVRFTSCAVAIGRNTGLARAGASDASVEEENMGLPLCRAMWRVLTPPPPYWLPRAVAGPSAGTDSPGGLESRSRSSSFISLGTMAPTATGALRYDLTIAPSGRGGGPHPPAQADMAGDSLLRR